MTQREILTSIIEYKDNEVGKRVKIKYTSKDSYKMQGLVGKCGIVDRVSGGTLGVLVDGKRNNVSAYGLFWFDKDEVNFLNNESEGFIMEGYKNVAIVNLLDDYSKKDYCFALYDEDLDLISAIQSTYDAHAMVVVNARGKNNRILGTVKEVMPIENYKGVKPTAEVVGVVNMNNHIAREVEKERLAELAKKKAAIEAELEKEISKRKSVEYYEEMAKQYADNPRLAELVAELKCLGV